MDFGFQIGDRVECVCEGASDNNCLHIGMTGYVCDIITNSAPPVGVQWEENVGGHRCREHCQDGHGWYVEPREIKPAEEENEAQFDFDEGLFRSMMGR